MFNILIVEDDKEYRSQYRDYLKQMEAQMGESFQIREFEDGDGILENYRADYDIILMDIEMSFVNGMEAAEEIRKLDHEVVIIFITNMPQYAIQGYRVDALDYVLKPISYFAFSQRIDRALMRVKRKETTYLTVAQKGGMRKLDVSKISYVEVRDHLLIYHLPDEEIVAKGSMNDAESALDGRLFFRCNRCYLVNLEYVEDFRGNDVTVAGDLIQVSRSRKKPFLDALNNYMNEVGN